MIPQYTPGLIIPFIYEEMTLEEVERVAPKLEAFYLIQAIKGSALPESFTGRAMGDIYFKNGLAKVPTLYDKRMLLMRGCIDRTTSEMYDLLSKRNLKRILVIRNAAFGDVTMITPALIALREKYPDAIIHFYGRDDSRDVILFNHYVDAIIDVRTTEIGALKYMYDEVFDMVHTIECNPTADYKTALDVAHQYLLLDKPKGVSNFYQFNENEIKLALGYMNEIGLRQDKKIIFFQYEGTALARSLNPITTFKVANYLAEQGYQVLLWSHRPDFGNYSFFLCEETKKITAQSIEDKTSEQLLLRNVDGKETMHSRLRLHPDVKFILRDKEGKNMMFANRRAKFAITYFISHFLTVDSFFSHLADALDKTSTIIFTNYHPYTRTKYYSKSNVVHLDYKNELPCGPCNGLINDCSLFGENQIPPCSNNIKAEKIIEAVLSRMNGENKAFEEMRDTPSIPEDYEEHKHRCKVCDSEDTDLITVKANVPYLRCYSCYSIFADEKKYSDQVKFLRNPYYLMNRNMENPDFLAQSILKYEENKEIKITDVIKIEDEERLGGNSPFYKNSNKFKKYSFDSEEKFGKLTMMIDIPMEFSSHQELVSYIDKRTEQGDKIFLLMPIANKWDFSNKWKPIFQPIAGINQIIYSEEAMIKLFAEKRGIYSDTFKIIAVNEINGDATMYCLEKMR